MIQALSKAFVVLVGAVVAYLFLGPAGVLIAAGCFIIGFVAVFRGTR